MISQIIINPITQHAESFAKATFNAFTPLCELLMASFISLWLAKAIYNAVFLGEFEIRQHLNKLCLFIALAAILITNTNLYWNYVYEPIKLSTGSLIEAVSSLTPKSTQEKITNSAALIYTFENAISEITKLLLEVCSKTGIFAAPLVGFISVVIWFAFVASLSIFSLYWIGNTLKLCALSALSPLLILACLFEKTRGHIFAGIKYVLTSSLLLIIAAFCIGLVLFAIREVLAVTDLTQISVFNMLSTCSTLFFVAWAAIYFLMIAPEMASAIMGSQSGSIFPGITGGVMTAGMGLGALTSSRSGGVIGSAARASAFAARAAVRGTASVLNSVRNRFGKNYSPETSSQQT